MKKIHMIGNTHFDPVWLWKWDEAMSSITATFKAALERMNEYPGFIYSFATPPVFEWIKNTNPALFEEIKERVKEGRWEIHEGWWLQPDCFTPMGESLARQGLYGQRYLKENFGKYTNTVFNIDSFGHPEALPQILKKSGIDNYMFCRPETKHVELENPFFNWMSKDGSVVKACRDDEEPYVRDIGEMMEKMGKENYDSMLVYGVTDHGGAPTIKAINQIIERQDADFSTVKEFFDNHKTDYTVTGELVTGDFGVYVNNSQIKAKNRKAEYAVLNAEKSCIIAQNPQREKLTKCWQDILFNQFHDILGGASIKEAYVDAFDLYGRAISDAKEIMHYNLLKVTNNINMPGKNPDNVWNIVVWNLNTTEYNGYIESEVQWVHEHPWYDKDIVLEDESGKKYECQIIRERSVIPRFRSRFLFKADIPAFGYKAFKVVQTGEDIISKTFADVHKITNGNYVISFDDKGFINEVYDNKNNKIVCKNLVHPVCFEDDGDTWAFNIEGHGNRLEDFKLKNIQVTECGNLRKILKVTYTFRTSKIDMYYTFYQNESYMDVHYRVNWNEKHTILKLLSDVSANEHIASVPYGNVKRGENKREVPLGEWLVTDNMMFSADSIFSYNMFDKKLGLNILRSPIYGDLRISDIDLDTDYDIMEQGILEGNVRMWFEIPSCPNNQAICFNNQPVVLCEANHKGELRGKGSTFSYRCDNVSVIAVKYAEDDDSVIVRGVENCGKSCDVDITFNNVDYKINVDPYEIFTVKLTDGKLEKVNILEE